MNQLAHVFLTYFILSFLIPDAQKYFLPIALFAVVLDMDHIPGYIRMGMMTKKQREGLKEKDYVELFRTILQEPISIVVLELIFLILYLYGVRSTILFIAAAAIFLHWLVDFLTVHTRPLDPFNKKVICFFPTIKQRVRSEIAITIVSLILFLIVFF